MTRVQTDCPAIKVRVLRRPLFLFVPSPFKNGGRESARDKKMSQNLSCFSCHMREKN